MSLGAHNGCQLDRLWRKIFIILDLYLLNELVEPCANLRELFVFDLGILLVGNTVSIVEYCLRKSTAILSASIPQSFPDHGIQAVNDLHLLVSIQATVERMNSPPFFPSSVDSAILRTDRQCFPQIQQVLPQMDSREEPHWMGE
jgi:hypothetical protein